MCANSLDSGDFHPFSLFRDFPFPFSPPGHMNRLPPPPHPLMTIGSPCGSLVAIHPSLPFLLPLSLKNRATPDARVWAAGADRQIEAAETMNGLHDPLRAQPSHLNPNPSPIIYNVDLGTKIARMERTKRRLTAYTCCFSDAYTCCFSVGTR